MYFFFIYSRTDFKEVVKVRSYKISNGFVPFRFRKGKMSLKKYDG